ncbi:protein kinase [Actinomycetes bacterium KLBMP 9759]
MRFTNGVPASGQIVARRYLLHELIGAGDLGMVWRATDEVLGRTVAIKRLSGTEPPERLMREARLASHVEHPRLLRVLDLVDEDGPWLVVQYVDALPWSALWLRRRIGARAAAQVAAQVADALAALHAVGLVHGDVTPDNVLVDKDGEVKLVDFGASHILGEGGEDGGDPGSRMTGTRDYRSPEVRAGAAAGPASDVYALGAMLRDAARSGGDALAPLLAAMLAATPADRPSAVTARDVLAAIAAGRPTTPP